MSKQQIKKVTQIDSIVFRFPEVGDLTCSLKELSPEMRDRMALHGLAAKIGDAYSKNEGYADAKGKAVPVWESLLAGEFNRRSTGGGSSTNGRLAAALVNISGKPIQDVMDLLDSLDDKAKKLLRQDVKVKKEIARLELASLEEKQEDDGLDIVGMFAQ